MNRVLQLCVASALVGLTGCSGGNSYEVELTPSPQGLRRDLSLSSSPPPKDGEPPPFDDPEVRRLTAAFENGEPTWRDDAFQFSGTFPEAMPNDVGGRGWFYRWDSTLGTFTLYVERFRGNDDYVETLERRQEEVQRLAAHIQGWLTEELRGAKGFDQLELFLSVDLPRDVKNLATYGWAIGIASRYSEDAGSDGLVRISQFLAERQYFAFSDLPRLNRIIREESPHAKDDALKLLREFLCRKLDAADPPPEMDFLKSPEQAKESLETYLSKSGEFAQRLADWEEARKTNPDAQKPTPEVLLRDWSLGVLILILGLDIGRDNLQMAYNSDTEPFFTNGKWDARKSRVEWKSTGISDRGGRMQVPTVCYVFTARPAAAEQTARFGKLVLDDRQLAEYCLWRNALTADEGAQWDKMLKSLSPADALMRLESFRFSGERTDAPPGEARPQPAAAQGIGLLRDGLERS